MSSIARKQKANKILDSMREMCARTVGVEQEADIYVRSSGDIYVYRVIFSEAVNDKGLREGHLTDTVQQPPPKKRRISAETIQHLFDEETAGTREWLRCKRCGNSTDVSWSQKQTRASDEPMTIFCSCGSCGARWRF